MTNMKTSVRRAHSLARCVGIAVLQVWFVAIAQGSSFQLVSAPGPQFVASAGAAGDSYLPVVSRDGRYVLFGSTADNLVAPGTNRPIQALLPSPINVFLRDRTNSSTMLVSVNSDGTAGGNGDSLPIGISTNGRYALFESRASNLVPGDTNNAADVFLRDLQANSTILVSASTNGGFADGASYSSVMTPDGRYVAFTSAADNLVPEDTNGIPDVFVRDMASNITTAVSAGAQLPPPVFYGSLYLFYLGSDTPVITPDGRYIAFYSTVTNLAPGVNTRANVYLRDQKLGITTWASAGAVPALQSFAAAQNALSFNHALSEDGRFVVFEAVGYSLTYSTPAPACILRYDTQTGQTDVVDTNATAPVTINFESLQDLSTTPDGRFTAYVANAVDTSGTTTAIRVWDAQTGVSTLVSGNTNNSVTKGSRSDSPVVDDTGRFVAFVSSPPDTNGNATDFHIYLRDLQTGITALVDADTNGAASLIDPSTSPAMTGDATLIAFHLQEGVPGPLNAKHAYDVLARDLKNSALELISARDPNLPSLTPRGTSVISSSSVSSDARFISFWSDADDLVANDTNGLRDVFVRDALSGTNVLASVNTNGLSGDGFSTDSAISADGRYVAFTSFADDLVTGDTNRATDVFVRDLQAGTTTLVSVNASGTGPGYGSSYSPLVSTNGQIVLFHSQASDIVPGVGFPPNIDNLFWRDLNSKRTHALTTNAVNNNVAASSMTPDASLVAFCTASRFSTAPPSQLFVWDATSASILYTLTGGGINSFGPLAISPNGQRLAYVTNAPDRTQIVALDRSSKTNWVIASYQGTSTSSPRFSADSRYLVYVSSLGVSAYTNQIYLYDFQTGTNQLISLGYDGVSPGNNDSDSPDISSDARFISYRSSANNLVPGVTNMVPNIYLYDRSSGAIRLITASRFGDSIADNRSLTPVFSGDGQTLLFESWADDLIPNDFNHNVDVFSLELYGGTVVPAFTVSLSPAADPVPSNWLSWPVVPGKTYRVQFKQQLEDPAWQDLNGQISIIGERGYFNDAASGNTHRFYRIVAF